MALGVAFVVLAMAPEPAPAWTTAWPVSQHPLHALNIFIAMLSPTIHTLRLHYVEFFSEELPP